MKKLSLMLVVSFLLAGIVNAQYEVGDKVKDFSLKNVNDKTVSLSDYDDEKGVILVFTCNTCPVAQKYEDRIIELHKEFASKGYPVVAVNPNDITKQPGDSMDEMKKRAKKKDYDFAYLRDDNQKLAKSYGAERTPEVFVLENTGEEFVIRYTGAIDNNVDNASAADKHYVEDAINKLMAGKDLAVTKTKAVGCTIKWK